MNLYDGIALLSAFASGVFIMQNDVITAVICGLASLLCITLSDIREEMNRMD